MGFFLIYFLPLPSQSAPRWTVGHSLDNIVTALSAEPELPITQTTSSDADQYDQSRSGVKGDHESVESVPAPDTDSIIRVNPLEIPHDQRPDQGVRQRMMPPRFRPVVSMLYPSPTPTADTRQVGAALATVFTSLLSILIVVGVLCGVCKRTNLDTLTVEEDETIPFTRSLPPTPGDDLGKLGFSKL